MAHKTYGTQKSADCCIALAFEVGKEENSSSI